MILRITLNYYFFYQKRVVLLNFLYTFVKYRVRTRKYTQVDQIIIIFGKNNSTIFAFRGFKSLFSSCKRAKSIY